MSKFFVAFKNCLPTFSKGFNISVVTGVKSRSL